MSGYTEYMLDLETLGTSPNDAIIAIGISPMDIDGRTLGEGFYAKVDATSCQKLGMRIDASTVMWWMGQSQAARQEFSNNHEHAPIETALEQAAMFIRQTSRNADKKYIRVWGNGAIMDNAMLLAAFKLADIEAPWAYKGDMCYRTLRELTPNVESIKPEIAHHALSDAEAQAKTLFLRYDALGI